ncbi:exonuclease [Lacrimispora saccharolytica]|uniref:DNA polymerase B exonuclease n=1 Tax=Lacrimispora saccharolytica (strain ATCC 35040 / DSM 2544 / NRCC 2533 / WM1) TaxID=610130 RepID=D9R368_LACSW|nr:exonuclease [Lacrimispora saccharolytica]ADL04817.1 DNA polymerase B exonuclease [[Clostridium] saccharolyticum WM1]QRV20971.1 exonuclease [Lacrimispora saccharolytica]
MITLQKTIAFHETYAFERIGRHEDLLFFDIETTGFSGEYSMLYLIGCVYYRNNCWNLIQWFADTPDSEKELLETFFVFLKDFTVIIHFNGDGFDIPYLLKRCLAYGLTYDFSGVESLDIYKKIRPYRGLLGLSAMKQKSIEEFLKVERKDLYSGGQLIEVYKDYLVSHNKYLFDLLILHNEDDLKGMPLILPILNYPDFLEHNFFLEHQELICREDIFGREFHSLRLSCKNGFSVPIGFTRSNSLVSLEAEGECLTVTIDLYEGELKYFYPDYKNYYYLIYEDKAIHKSVAEYVDKEARIKATAKTCYTRRKGCYLPQFTPLWTPCLQAEFKDKITYLSYEPDFFEDGEKLCLYIRHLLDILRR